ncbi:MAG: hypothetical protein R3C19_17700 [Planctomycetaceae bacterium]
MSTFTGLQQQASRRRRRLATDDLELLAEFGTEIHADDDSDEPAEPEFCAVRSDELLPRMVFRKLWKQSLLVAAVVLLGMIAVALDQSFAANFVATAEATPRLQDGLAGIYLLVSGQLALLIGWIRSRSAVDFNGRYRWWKWLSALLIVSGIVWLTNSQHTLPVLVAELARPLIGGVTAARGTLVIVPMLALGSLVIVRIVPDMSRCRTSQALFCLGLLLLTARFALKSSAAGLTISPSELTTVLLSAATCLVAAMLLHSRYVLFVSNDPPVAARKPAAKPARLSETDAPQLPAAANSGPAKVPADSTPQAPAAQSAVPQKKNAATKVAAPKVAAPKIAAPKAASQKPPAAATSGAAPVNAAASAAKDSAKKADSKPTADEVAAVESPARQSRKSKKKRRRAA